MPLTEPLTPQDPRLALRGRVVLPDAVLEDGVVVIAGDRLGWVGPWAQAGDVLAPGARVRTVHTILPGLVDLHCHGGGGASFPDATDAAQVLTAAHEHLRHGTTSLVASLVTADAATLLERTALLADAADAGELAGIHLEGPFLSAARCGAQDPRLMVPGDADLVRAVAETARGHLATMTVAPEVPGVLTARAANSAPECESAVGALAAVGAVPSFGHTDAPAELVEAGLAQAVEALASPGSRSARPTVTHLFNGMRPLHHRDPGPVAACLAAAARGAAVVELVADDVHLAPATVRSVFAMVGPGSVALVTDAMAAAGMPDGTYQLGPMAVRVAGGVARLADGDAIAGGTAHLLDVVRATVSAGVPLADAVRAAATTPAAVLGRPDLGALEAGRRADVLVVDAELRPVEVLRAGRPAGGSAGG